jgi:c-di-GMP phosphodiesterase
MSPALLTSVPTGALREVAPETDASPLQVPRFILRQPVLDTDFRILGYELRIKEASPLPVLPGAASIHQIRDEALLSSAIDADYQQAMSRRLTFLNLAPGMLDSPLLAKLPRENCVLAVHPANPTPALLARCQSLAAEGYALALDEAAVWPGMLPLAEQSRFLRFNVADIDLMGLCDRLVRLHGIHGPRLIARNVASEETFTACRKLSFDLFQGYFFTVPGQAGARAIDTSRLRIIQLLNLVISRAELRLVEAQFKLDPGLTFKLLRFINSPGVGLLHPIRSIGHALLMLGHDQLYRWLTLLLFTHQDNDGRSRSLLKNALVRARFMEILGQDRLSREQRDGQFIVGILSMLDALLNLPMTRALEPLKLAEPIVNALLRGDGIHAAYLRLAAACEEEDSNAITRLAATLDLRPDAINLAHMHALAWSEGMDI